MRTPSSVTSDPMDDCDDIFGPPRTYPTCYPPKNRPSMISAKYKLKEERRKVLKISLNKLKKIDDPEANLRRSVLINNTMKRLQQETRDEKLQKQLSYPRCYSSNDSYVNIKSEFLKNERASSSFATNDDLAMDTDFQTRLVADEINLNELLPVEETAPPCKKRPYEELADDCDVHDVLSQFYLPPTPRMITALDDTDEDINVVDSDDPLVKRLKLNDDESQDFNKTVTTYINNNLPGRYDPIISDSNSGSSSFSCGQASMFGEMQQNVYSLLASLET